MVCDTCALVITEYTEVVNGETVVRTTAHQPNCPETWADADYYGAEPSAADLHEDYPGQYITGPDCDTRDREGL